MPSIPRAKVREANERSMRLLKEALKGAQLTSSPRTALRTPIRSHIWEVWSTFQMPTNRKCDCAEMFALCRVVRCERCDGPHRPHLQHRRDRRAGQVHRHLDRRRSLSVCQGWGSFFFGDRNRGLVTVSLPLRICANYCAPCSMVCPRRRRRHLHQDQSHQAAFNAPRRTLIPQP